MMVMGKSSTRGETLTGWRRRTIPKILHFFYPFVNVQRFYEELTRKWRMCCLYCNYESACNATKMAYHIAKMKGGDIRLYAGKISQKCLCQNQDLWDSVIAKANVRR